jgi:hypothetical protein
MLQRLAPLLGSGYSDCELFFDIALAYALIEMLWPKRNVKPFFLLV